MTDQMQLERKYIRLGDFRRNERFIKIVNTFIAHPNLSVPNTFPDWYELKATYTFWKSKHVNYSDMHNSIVQATIERARNHETVLCIQDTTNISLGVDAEGLGYLDHGVGKGFLCHNNICFTTKGIPIGILDIFPWIRKFEDIGKRKTRSLRVLPEKESYRWIESKSKAESSLSDKVGKLVTIADREADIFELFAAPRPKNSHILIRATHDRKTETGAGLWESLESKPVSVTKRISVQRKTGIKYREAILEIREGTFKIKSPRNKPGLGTIEVQAILVREKKAAKGEAPIEWVLLTTLPIKEKEDLLTYIEWYTYRWRIERFHYVLKSGCKVEQLQLKNVSQLQKAMLTLSQVAIKLLGLTYQSRDNGEESCEGILEKEEWQTLCISHGLKGLEIKAPTINQAIRWIAMLGGYIGRKSDGSPGVKTLWQGFKCLHERTIMLKELYNNDFSFG